MFKPEIIQVIKDRIEDRVISVQNYNERKHPVLPHYKAADSAELARTLINILLTLSNAEKQSIVDTLNEYLDKST